MRPHSATDGEEVGSGFYQGQGVVHRDAADGDARHFEEFGPPGEDFRLGAVDDLFGVGGIEGAEGDVVGAGFSGFHGQMAGVVAGDADDGFVADGGAGLFVGHVILAHMHAVAAGLEGEVGAVVEDEGDASALDFGAQEVDGAANLVVGQALKAQLHAGDISGIEGGGQGLGEGRDVGQAGRRHQIEAAGGGNGRDPLKCGAIGRQNSTKLAR